MKTLASLVLVSAALFAAAPEEFSTSAGILQIIPIQHASLVLKAGGKVLYVDPAQGVYDGLPQADYILITDIHGDHMAPAVVDKLKKASTVIVAPKAVAEKFPGALVMANGGTLTVGPFKVDAIAMYNLKPAADGQTYHEKGRGNGYIVTYGGKRFYFAGDTEGTPEMRALKNIDVAFIPMNLPYTMTPQAAAEAVRAFHPAVVFLITTAVRTRRFSPKRWKARVSTSVSAIGTQSNRSRCLRSFCEPGRPAYSPNSSLVVEPPISMAVMCAAPLVLSVTTVVCSNFFFPVSTFTAVVYVLSLSTCVSTAFVPSTFIL